MKRIAAISLVLGLFALPAAADSPRNGRHDGASDRTERFDRSDRERAGDRDHQTDRDRASDRHRAHDRYARVQTVAHRLERATGELRDAAHRHAHRRSPREMTALHALRNLDIAARRFHGKVERSRGPLQMEHELRDVTLAFRYAKAHARALHSPRGVDRGFDRVERLVRELRVVYADTARHRHAGRYAHARPGFPFRWFVAHAGWR